MSRLERIAEGLLRPINPYATVLLGALTLVWGMWIVNPFWNVFPTSRVYSQASDFAPEWAWGTWSTLCGALILISLYKGSYKYLVRFLGFATWHWSTISTMFFWGDWQNTAGVTYGFIAIYCIYSYLNIKVNYDQPGKPEEF